MELIVFLAIVISGELERCHLPTVLQNGIVNPVQPKAKFVTMECVGKNSVPMI